MECRMIESFKGLPLWVRLLLGCTLIILAVSLIFLSALYFWYWVAIRNASTPEESEVSEKLRAISEENNDLVWTGEPRHRRVLVVTWAAESESFRRYDAREPLRRGESFETGKDIWVTVVPDLKVLCKTTEPKCSDSTLRLKQLLGLPPHAQKARFVEFWVSPTDLFRPCPDPEIDDTACNVEHPANTDPDHPAWFDKQRRDSYSYGPFGYPWTQLGYTYDWGSVQGGIGPSEFVIKECANVKVRSVQPTNVYLQRPIIRG